MKFLKITALALFLSAAVTAQDKTKIASDSKSAKAAFKKTDPTMQSMFEGAYAYVIFPNIGKGALIVGGAGGNGGVYEKGTFIGTAKMVQATVGAQIGGKAYREVIFFEDKSALDRFRENKFEFSAGISALAVKSGVSANAKYADGVAVFTEDRGGLMADVSVGGQKFTFKPLN